MKCRHRVVVTGIGAIAANGTGNKAFWESLRLGQSGIDNITLFDARALPIQIAGEVKNFDLRDFFDNTIKVRRMARHTQLALAASQIALTHAGLTIEALQKIDALALVLGVSTSAFDVIEAGKERMQKGGFQRVSAYFVESSQPHGVATLLAKTLSIQARCQTISSACASGSEAIAQGANLIRGGQAEMALVGGTDATVTPLAMASFITAGMLPRSNGEPTLASRPFDRNREGGILAEGAGMLVLENLRHALARGAQPLAEITGHGTMIDAPLATPGAAMAEAMQMALDNAGRYPEDMEYICAHGPSDPILDEVETLAIKDVFKDRAYRIPVSSIKGVTGNPLAAAGPLQACACVLAMTNQMLPPTANYETPDPNCDLDYVPRQARHFPLRRALVNVHGMGGINTSLCMEQDTWQ